MSTGFPRDFQLPPPFVSPQKTVSTLLFAEPVAAETARVSQASVLKSPPLGSSLPTTLSTGAALASAALSVNAASVDTFSKTAKTMWSVLKPRVFLCLVLAVGTLSGLGLTFRTRPFKPLAEIPVAYWAWRNDAPTGADVRAATGRGRGSALFLRAGQIELKKDALRRIRPAGGAFPDRLPLHLVYNATPEVLFRFEHIETATLAACILETFAADRARARREHATVAGLQLDIDCPTRLLNRYRETLRIVRAGLPAGYGLSITGLPTWMNAPELPQLLKETDFWTPQCYGWRIPETMADLTPIAEPEAVGRAVARAENLGHPYFAGIAAYGYLLHFDRTKRRLSLRGDISAAEIRGFPARLIDRDSVFETWRAETDFVIDGLGVRAGEFLVFEKPSAERFAASLEAARTSSGPALRGFCLFRLPAPDDPTTLPLDAVAAALNGTPIPESPAPPGRRSVHFTSSSKTDAASTAAKEGPR